MMVYAGQPACTYIQYAQCIYRRAVKALVETVTTSTSTSTQRQGTARQEWPARYLFYTRLNQTHTIPTQWILSQQKEVQGALTFYSIAHPSLS